MGQIVITCIHNPFDPLGSREIRQVPAGIPVRDLFSQFYPAGMGDYDVAVSVNGVVRHDLDKMDLLPLPGDSIAFCAVPAGGGGGKNPLAIIAMLALVVVAPYAAGFALEGIGGMAFTGGWVAGSTTIGLATAGIMAVGGMVVSSVFSPSIPDSPGAGSFANSSTYSWTPGGNAVTEGGVLPEIIGTHRVTPPLIGHYIETTGDKQYLNLLFAVAGHAVDSIDGIRINDTAIEDFVGVDYEVRLGAADQAVLQYFADTRSDVAVGAKLSNTAWTTRTTTGNAVQGIGVGISLPKGLYYANDSGGMDSQTVKVYVEYSVHDADDWTRLQSYEMVETAATESRWTAGYWRTLGDFTRWIELEEGSTTPGDHIDGDPYGTTTWIAEEGRYYHSWRWLTWTTGATVFVPGDTPTDHVEIMAAQTAPIHRMFYKDNLTPGQYDIRCQLVEALPADARYGNDTYFESFQEIVYDDFQYPGVSPLAVRALATDQLSGSMPRIDCLVTRSTVPVWTGAAYENLSASNPAWASYHLLHKGGDGVPYSRIVYADFLAWADWCDEKGYTVNLYVDSVFSLRRALDMVGLNGRGTVVQRGSKFSCIVDRPEALPVQRFLFTSGNIIKDSFSEEFLPMDSRANAIEVTYFDADLDYSRQTVTLYASDFDTTDREINTTQVTLYGCTDRDLAISYGQFMLNCNRYLTLTASFDADVDALACTVGDVIDVAHDVPQWGYSGRVISADSNTLEIDRIVTMEEGKSYEVTIKHADDTRETRTVTAANLMASGFYADAGDGFITEPPADGFSASTDTTVPYGYNERTFLSISPGWSVVPSKYDLYSFGETNLVSKKMRIVRISRSQEMRRKLICIEHVDEVYDDGAVIPAPVSGSSLPAVARLTATEIWKGGIRTSVALKWSGEALAWNVFSRPTATMGWTRIGQALQSSYEISSLDQGTAYDFAVSPTLNPGDGESTVSPVTPAGQPITSADITGLGALAAKDTVSTADIGADAITVKGTDATAAYSYGTPFNEWKDIGPSVTITFTDGASVLVLSKGWCYYSSGAAFGSFIRILRGTSDLVDYTNFQFADVTARSPFSLLTLDAPGPGTFTYKLQANSGYGVEFNNMTLTLLELLR